MSTIVNPGRAEAIKQLQQATAVMAKHPQGSVAYKIANAIYQVAFNYLSNKCDEHAHDILAYVDLDTHNYTGAETNEHTIS